MSAIEVSNLSSNTHRSSVSLLQPSTMEDAFKLCQVLSKSDLVPRSYRGKAENVFLAFVAGQPFGWDATMSMRSFHIIEGQPTLKPEIQVALVRQAGHSISVKKSAVDEVILVGRRSDTGDTAEVSYTIEDAKRANLVGKGNWKTYPEDMLFARAVSRMCRRLFQDVLLGCAYVPEELGATVNPDGDVLEITPAREVATLTLVEAIDEEDDELIDDMPETPSVRLDDYADEITQSQIARIHILVKEAGLSDEKYRAGLMQITGQDTSKGLNVAQGDAVIEALERSAARARKAAEEEAW